jgi:hypothetical protein
MISHPAMVINRVCLNMAVTENIVQLQVASDSWLQILFMHQQHLRYLTVSVI